MAAAPQHAMMTSGDTDAVWIHTEPYSHRPKFSKLDKDVDTDVCIIGSGIVGVSVAFELVKRGVNVVMIEARDILAGKSDCSKIKRTIWTKFLNRRIW